MRTPDRIPTLSAAIALVAAAMLIAPCAASALEFERVVIDRDFPGVSQVEVEDVNGDGTCVWYENPSWKKRIMTTRARTPGIVSSATADLDGNGKAEIAIAYDFVHDDPARGKLLLATQGKGPDDPWAFEDIDDLGSIHRLRWLRFAIWAGPNSVSFKAPAEGRREAYKHAVGTYLAAAPLFGPLAEPPAFQDPARLVLFRVSRGVERPTSHNMTLIPKGHRMGPEDPTLALRGEIHAGKLLQGTPREIGRVPVLHAIDVVDIDGNGAPVVLAASNVGVTYHGVDAIAGDLIFGTHPLAAGAPGDALGGDVLKKGACEVGAGCLKDGRRFLATIEPWYGTELAVYLSGGASKFRPVFGPRAVIDGALKEGRALWVGDVDRDGDDEIVAGDRGSATGVLMYDFNGEIWMRTVVDAKTAVQDLRGGDLDRDGNADVVAAGGKTHEVIWYKSVANPRPR
jgi:hypothetical protein